MAGRIAVVAAIITALYLLFPAPALAYNPLFEPENWIKFDVLKPAIEGLLNGFADFLKSATADNMLIGDFKSLFGSGSSQADKLWNTVNAVHETLLVPLGESILALVMLVQVIKISQKIDAQATLPTVKEIVFLAVFYVIFHFLIVNSVDICAAVYDEINKISVALNKSYEFKSSVNLGDVANANIGVMVVAMLTAALVYLSGLVCSIVVYVMAAARAIQLYVMAIFSPIPFSLMGFEETRSMGVNFCKNFLAVCLAGAIMVFMIVIFPTLFASVVGSAALFGDDGNLAGAAIVKMLALPFLFIIGLIKSGAWARDLLGG